jgi:hypothetical protein
VLTKGVYVSADRGKAPALKLLEACTLNQTNEVRFLADAVPVAGEIAMLARSRPFCRAGAAAATKSPRPR